jgi:small basic protein
MVSFANLKEDRFIRGIISGIIAGILKDVPAVILKYLIEKPHSTFWDYMSLLTLGKIPNSWDEYLLSLIVEVLWCAVLAIIFVYLQPKFQSEFYIVQGVGYGTFIWLLIRAMVYFFQTSELIHDRPLAALMNLSISIFYGVTVAVVNHKLEFAPKTE